MKVIDKYNKIITLIILFFLCMLITFGIKYYFKPFIAIIFLLIATKPLYNFFYKIGISYGIAGALSILIINVIIFCFIFYFGNEIIDIGIKLFKSKSNSLQIIEDNVKTLFGIDIDKIINNGLKNFTGSVLKSGATFTGQSIMAYVIGNITTYFLLVDKDKVLQLICRMFPIEMVKMAREKKNNLKEVIKIELILVLSCTFIIIIGFLILRIPSSFLLGILCGILDVLPYVGTIIVFIPIIIYNIVMKNYLIVIGLIALYILSQIVREILEVKFLSSKLEVHPLAIMLSIYIGAEIFGLIGILVGPIYCLIAKDIIYS